LKNVVFYPIGVLASCIWEKKVKPKMRFTGSEVVNFRLRCILTQQLFLVIEQIGMRAQMPMDLASTTLYKWMTNDFLNYKQYKRKETGSKYTCSNLPVIVAVIVHLVENGEMEVSGDYYSIFKQHSGDVTKPYSEKMNSVRDTFKVKFTLKVNPPITLTFPSMVSWMIFGCGPFHPAGKAPPKRNTEQFVQFQAFLNKLDLRNLLRTIWLDEKLIKQKVKVDNGEKKVMLGFLPNDVHQRLMNKKEQAMAKQTEDDQKETCITYLKEQESRYLNLAANLRMHIAVMENMPSDDAMAGQEQSDGFGGLTETTQPDDDEEPNLYKHMANFQYLKEKPVVDGQKKANVFPHQLQVIGDELGTENVKAIRSMGIDYSQDMESIWNKYTLAQLQAQEFWLRSRHADGGDKDNDDDDNDDDGNAKKSPPQKQKKVKKKKPKEKTGLEKPIPRKSGGQKTTPSKNMADEETVVQLSQEKEADGGTVEELEEKGEEKDHAIVTKSTAVSTVQTMKAQKALRVIGFVDDVHQEIEETREEPHEPPEEQKDEGSGEENNHGAMNDDDDNESGDDNQNDEEEEEDDDDDDDDNQNDEEEEEGEAKRDDDDDDDDESAEDKIPLKQLSRKRANDGTGSKSKLQKTESVSEHERTAANSSLYGPIENDADITLLNTDLVPSPVMTPKASMMKTQVPSPLHPSLTTESGSLHAVFEEVINKNLRKIAPSAPTSPSRIQPRRLATQPRPIKVKVPNTTLKSTIGNKRVRKKKVSK
jgi:hypothetical protein